MREQVEWRDGVFSLPVHTTRRISCGFLEVIQNYKCTGLKKSWIKRSNLTPLQTELVNISFLPSLVASLKTGAARRMALISYIHMARTVEQTEPVLRELTKVSWIERGPGRVNEQIVNPQFTLTQHQGQAFFRSYLEFRFVGQTGEERGWEWFKKLLMFKVHRKLITGWSMEVIRGEIVTVIRRGWIWLEKPFAWYMAGVNSGNCCCKYTDWGHH